MTDHENELRNACAGLLREMQRVISDDYMRHSPEVARARAAIGKLELRGAPPKSDGLNEAWEKEKLSPGPSGRLFRAHGDGALSSDHVVWLKPGEISGLY